MNKIRTYLLNAASLLTLATGFTGCDNLFHDAPVDKLAEPSIWKSPLLLDEYTMPWYRNMHTGFNIFMSTSWLLRSMSQPFPAWYSDQITYSMSTWGRTGFADEQAGKETAITRTGSSTWGSCYEMIQHINRLLANQSGIADGASKQRILGEAHFFRGYYYYMLLRRFGAPMLIDHLYDPLNDNEKFPRSSYEKMAEFIASEAQQAADLLPAKYESQDVGRVTKGAAMMLKAKVYFWVGSPQFQNKDKEYYGFSGDRSKDMMQKAAAAYEQLVKSGLYSLMPVTGSTETAIADSYNKIFLTKNSAESIMEVHHSDAGIVEEFGHRLDEDATPPFLNGTRCAYVPTQNHVDEYGMRDGKTLDPQHPFDNRDYRFYANILYDGSSFRNHVMDIHYTMDGKKKVAGVDLTKYGTDRNAGVTRTGYYMRKFLDPTTSLFGDSKYGSKQNYIIWRYAEALLDYAEASFRTGNTTLALNLINQVRKRVHMSELTGITLEQILNERRVELAFEETTYWDYLRLGTAVDKLNGANNPLRGMEIVEAADGTKTYKVSDLKSQKTERVFRSSQNYYPIPWSEVRYHGFDQNADWNEK
uniref:RagB/SusD family nutrient uptake outer membrane protein n=1 Tax=Prevotella sp. GTC17260 TaxID=3236796 RepID=A0AB33JAA9_9BACT